MDCKDTTLSEQVLRAMAEAYPKPVHFGYLGLALGCTSGAMLRALRRLRQDGLVGRDRSLANNDVPYAQLRLSAKGQAVAAGMAQPADAAETLRHFELVTIANLQQPRFAAKTTPAGRTTPAATRPVAPPTQKAEQLLGSAAA